MCHVVEENRAEARRLVRENYPCTKFVRSRRIYTATQCTKVFIRDGFIDCYSGGRLVFPGTLRLLSLLLPEEFPFHPNWKMDSTHPAFWVLFPTIDHVVPVARGGIDTEENWVTTSQLRNSAKANWTLEELSWKLVPPGNIQEWDGLTRWFVNFIEGRHHVRGNNYLRTWLRAATVCLADIVTENDSDIRPDTTPY
jgi:hypothetical protein